MYPAVSPSLSKELELDKRLANIECKLDTIIIRLFNSITFNSMKEFCEYAEKYSTKLHGF